MKKSKMIIGMSSMLLLAACASKTSENAGTQQNFPIKVENAGTVIQGGTLKYAIVSDSPISGLLNSVFSDNTYDAEVIGFFDENLFGNDENFGITEGIGKLTYDLNNNTVTVTIKKDVKWSDGEPLTIDDYIYAFEVIANKDYTGIRYTSVIKNIEGVEEYREGKASSISGITKVDDYTVTFKLKELSTSLLQAGGFWSSAYPKHIFKDIPIKDQAAAEASRTKPVGLGAFRVTKVTSGESVTLEANPYYWQGKPKLDGVVIDVVNTTNSADEFKSGNYDIMSVSTQTAIYDSFKELKNGTLVGKWQATISYLGFKLGKYDRASDKVVADSTLKMSNQSLRQAMGYAINLDEISESFYGKLRIRANTLIPPVFGLHDTTNTGYPYDLEKAKKLLDDAGYKDIDGDGLRENPKGEKLVINFAMMSGGDSDVQAQTYIQQWKEAGLNVQLINGRTIEFNSFYKLVEEDNEVVDVFLAAWGVGGNPNPNNLWGTTATNYTRFTSESYQELLKKLDSKEMFDNDKKVAAYKEWQKVSNDTAFAIPLQYRTALTMVNKRVKSINLETGENNWSNHLHELQLTAKEPVK